MRDAQPNECNISFCYSPVRIKTIASKESQSIVETRGVDAQSVASFADHIHWQKGLSMITGASGEFTYLIPVPIHRMRYNSLRRYAAILEMFKSLGRVTFEVSTIGRQNSPATAGGEQASRDTKQWQSQHQHRHTSTY